MNILKTMIKSCNKMRDFCVVINRRNNNQRLIQAEKRSGWYAAAEERKDFYFYSCSDSGSIGMVGLYFRPAAGGWPTPYRPVLVWPR